jgi:hypothetical protein
MVPTQVDTGGSRAIAEHAVVRVIIPVKICNRVRCVVYEGLYTPVATDVHAGADIEERVAARSQGITALVVKEACVLDIRTRESLDIGAEGR